MRVTQLQIDRMIEQLAEQVRASGQHFDRIVGIERGGLHISVPLAKMLDLSHESIYISCYDGRVRREHSIIQGALTIGGQSLVVDDIVDTGETIGLYRQHCSSNFRVAALYWKGGEPEPDFYIEKTDQWVIAPWELEYED